MSLVRGFREFVNERLTAAAAEIFSVYERIIVQYEEEINRQRGLLDIHGEAQFNLYVEENLQRYVYAEEQPCNLENLEPSQFGMKQEELLAGQVDQRSVVFMGTPADAKSDPIKVEPGTEELLSHNSATDATGDQLAAAPHGTKSMFKQIVLNHTEGGGSQHRLLSIIQNPQIKLHRIDCTQNICKYKQRGKQAKSSSLCREEAEAPRSDDEQEEPEPLDSENEQEKPELSQFEDDEEEVGATLKELALQHETAVRAKAKCSEPEADQMAPCGVDVVASVAESQDQNQDRHENSSSSRISKLRPEENSHVADNHGQMKKKAKHFTCELCEKSFNQISRLKKHLKVHKVENQPADEEQQPSSPTSGKGCVETPDWTSHIRHHTDKKCYSCKTCGKTSTSRGTIQRHIRTHTGEKPYLCSICGQKFADQTTLLRHTRSHKGEKPYSCDTCGKAFTHRTSLTQHKKIHTGEKPFSCAQCNRSFSRLASLSRHMIKHTGNRPFQCEICGKKVLSLSHLVAHRRVHTGERPFSCTNCKQSFTCRTTLSNHMKKNADDSVITCATCGKSFFTHSCFLAHRRTHLGERPYSCETCGKTFNARGNYLTHLKIHTGEKPFSCLICGKKFGYRASLTYHRKVHADKTPTSECDQSFTQQESLSADLTEHTAE